MGTLSVYGKKPKKMFVEGKKVKAAYYMGEKIWSAGNIVTYCVDSGVSYQEEVDSDASCLSPTTFTPSKSGWTFIGWRTDTAANSSVLSSKTMGDDPITLYAVFRQSVTLSYNGNSATSGSVASQTGQRYYNNGNVSNPTFTLAANGFARTYYTFTGWNLGSPGATVTLSASTVAYAQWKETQINITLNNALAPGISKSFREYGGYSPWNASSYTEPTTGCVLHADGEDEINAYATLLFTGKVIPGNGGFLYIQSLMQNTGDYGLYQCVWKVQLYNVDTAAVTTLAQYGQDINGNVYDGAPATPAEFNATNGELQLYRLPSSGRYYLQMRYFAPQYGSHGRHVYCYLQNAYAITK